MSDSPWKHTFLNKEIKEWAALPPNTDDILNYYKFDSGLDPPLCTVQEGMVPKLACVLYYEPPPPNTIQASSDGSYTEDEKSTYGALLRVDDGDCLAYDQGDTPPVPHHLITELFGANRSVMLAIEERKLATEERKLAILQRKLVVPEVPHKLELVMDSREAIDLISSKLMEPGGDVPSASARIIPSTPIVPRATISTATAISTTIISRAAISSSIANSAPTGPSTPEEDDFQEVFSTKKKKAMNRELYLVKKKENLVKKKESVDVLKNIYAGKIATLIKANWKLDDVHLVQRPREKNYGADCVSRLAVREGSKKVRKKSKNFENRHLRWVLNNDMKGSYLLFNKTGETFDFVKKKLAYWANLNRRLAAMHG